MSIPSVSIPAGIFRRIMGFRTVTSAALSRPLAQAEFVTRCRLYRQEARREPLGLPQVVTALWKTEGLATTLGQFPAPDNTLDDPRLCESLAIAHVGYGTACAERAAFAAGRLHEILATTCEEHHRGFSVEGIGAALRIYEPGLVRSACGVFGLIPRDAARTPDRHGFFAPLLAGFSAEYRRLIAHGYGRLIAFGHLGLHRAIAEAVELPDPHGLPSVQGVAFAFAMMNSVELPRLLDQSRLSWPAPVLAAVRNGFVYALVFCDWFAPGLLSRWQARGSVEAQVIERASSQIAIARRRGYLLPFACE